MAGTQKHLQIISIFGLFQGIELISQCGNCGLFENSLYQETFFKLFPCFAEHIKKKFRQHCLLNLKNSFFNIAVFISAFKIHFLDKTFSILQKQVFDTRVFILISKQNFF